MLYLEYSAHRLRLRHPDGSGYLVFADALDKLEKGGFELGYIEEKARGLDFWKKSYQRGGDFKAWFFRPRGRDSMRGHHAVTEHTAKLGDWRDFRANLCEQQHPDFLEVGLHA